MFRHLGRDIYVIYNRIRKFVCQETTAVRRILIKVYKRDILYRCASCYGEHRVRERDVTDCIALTVKRTVKYAIHREIVCKRISAVINVCCKNCIKVRLLLFTCRTKRVQFSNRTDCIICHQRFCRHFLIFRDNRNFHLSFYRDIRKRDFEFLVVIGIVCYAISIKQYFLYRFNTEAGKVEFQTARSIVRNELFAFDNSFR